jgi:hypothetical protein
MTSPLLGSQSPREGIVLPFIFIGALTALSQAPLHHFLGAMVIVSVSPISFNLDRARIKGLSRPMNLSWILNTLLIQSLILLFPLALFFSISGVAKVVVKLILRSELPHVLTVRYKLWRFALYDKSFLVFFVQVFELLKGVLLFS